MAARKAATPRKTSAKATAKTTAKTTAPRKTTASARSAAKTKASTRSAAKTTAKKTIVVKPAKKPAVQGVTLQAPVVLGKKQLIEDVVARSGIKKKDAKPVIEAMLDVLGEAVAAGKTLNLQPFGKITMQKQNEKASARVSVVRIRQPNARARHTAPIEAEKVVKDPLAEAAE